MTELEEARAGIDRVDREMAALFEERMKLSSKVAAYKAATGMPVYDPLREEQVVSRGASYIADPDIRAFYAPFMRQTMALSKEHQKDILASGRGAGLLSGKKVLIVGLGLIGGSYAQGLTAAGCTVGAVTRSQDSIDYALGKGIISSGTTAVTGEYVGQFDIIIFSLYPHVFLSWIEKYQDFIKPGALLTDVTGVKGGVVYKVQGMLRDDLEFIGAHPMAGREKSGVQNSDDAVFRGANYIVTPTAANSTGAVRLCEEIGRVLGFARISSLSPEEHDEMIGFLSQLTHCIAVALMTCKESRHLVDYTGDSFRDLTRIARINENMWAELFLENKDELLAQIDLFMGKCKEMRDALANDDAEKMKEMMRLSTERRAYFDK